MNGNTTQEETTDGQDQAVPAQLQSGEISGDKNLWILKKETDDAWRMWDACGNNMGVMLVTGGNQITWNAHGSPMRFTFSRSDLSEYFQNPEELSSREGARTTANQDSISLEIADGDSLSMAVSEDGPTGRFSYSVHVVEADTVVEGNTPPVIIVI